MEEQLTALMQLMLCEKESEFFVNAYNQLLQKRSNTSMIQNPELMHFFEIVFEEGPIERGRLISFVEKRLNKIPNLYSTAREIEQILDFFMRIIPEFYEANLLKRDQSTLLNKDIFSILEQILDRQDYSLYASYIFLAHLNILKQQKLFSTSDVHRKAIRLFLCNKIIYPSDEFKVSNLLALSPNLNRVFFKILKLLRQELQAQDTTEVGRKKRLLIRDMCEDFNIPLTEDLMITLVVDTATAISLNLSSSLDRKNKNIKNEVNSAAIMIGATGGGKSALINYLCGTNFTFKQNERNGRSYLEADPGQNIPLVSGHGLTSQSLFAKVAVNENKDILFIDTPGFHDSRIDLRLCSSLGVPMALQSANQIRAVFVVIPWPSLALERGRMFSELVEILSSLFSDYSALLPEDPRRPALLAFVISKPEQPKRRFFFNAEFWRNAFIETVKESLPTVKTHVTTIKGIIATAAEELHKAEKQEETARTNLENKKNKYEQLKSIYESELESNKKMLFKITHAVGVTNKERELELKARVIKQEYKKIQFDSIFQAESKKVQEKKIKLEKHTRELSIQLKSLQLMKLIIRRTENQNKCCLLKRLDYLNKEDALNLSIESNAAYIRIKDKLYYLNKCRKDWLLLEGEQENALISFDKDLQLDSLENNQERPLSEEELDIIYRLTNHLHIRGDNIFVFRGYQDDPRDQLDHRVEMLKYVHFLDNLGASISKENISLNSNNEELRDIFKWAYDRIIKMQKNLHFFVELPAEIDELKNKLEYINKQEEEYQIELKLLLDNQKTVSAEDSSEQDARITKLKKTISAMRKNIDDKSSEINKLDQEIANKKLKRTEISNLNKEIEYWTKNPPIKVCLNKAGYFFSYLFGIGYLISSNYSYSLEESEYFSKTSNQIKRYRPPLEAVHLSSCVFNSDIQSKKIEIIFKHRNVSNYKNLMNNRVIITEKLTDGVKTGNFTFNSRAIDFHKGLFSFNFETRTGDHGYLGARFYIKEKNTPANRALLDEYSAIIDNNTTKKIALKKEINNLQQNLLEHEKYLRARSILERIRYLVWLLYGMEGYNYLVKTLFSNNNEIIDWLIQKYSFEKYKFLLSDEWSKKLNIKEEKPALIRLLGGINKEYKEEQKTSEEVQNFVLEKWNTVICPLFEIANKIGVSLPDIQNLLEQVKHPMKIGNTQEKLETIPARKISIDQALKIALKKQNKMQKWYKDNQLHLRDIYHVADLLGIQDKPVPEFLSNYKKISEIKNFNPRKNLTRSLPSNESISISNPDDKIIDLQLELESLTSITAQEAAQYCKTQKIRGFQAIDTDGNCFFRAVLASLGNDQEEHLALRNKAIEYIRLHKDYFIPFFEHDGNNTIEDYCQNMLNEGVWVEGVIIPAVAEILECKINVIDLSKKENGDIRLNFYATIANPRSFQREIKLIRVNNNHYHASNCFYPKLSCSKLKHNNEGGAASADKIHDATHQLLKFMNNNKKLLDDSLIKKQRPSLLDEIVNFNSLNLKKAEQRKSPLTRLDSIAETIAKEIEKRRVGLKLDDDNIYQPHVYEAWSDDESAEILEDANDSGKSEKMSIQ